MKSPTAWYRLPVVANPNPGEAAVIIPGDTMREPFFIGNGPINLICGRCQNLLAKGMHPGQIENLVLQCWRCRAYCAVVSIPALEEFVAHVQASPAAAAKLPAIAAALDEAHKRRAPQEQVVAEVRANFAELEPLTKLLVPQSAGDFYGLLGALVGFLAWYQTRKPVKEAPSVVINQYFATPPPEKMGRNAPCPCGSGKKFKKCHGK